MELNGEARGKLLLFGEHAVVHGFPAVGLTLPLSTRVSMSQPGAGDPSSEIPNQAPLVQRLVPYMGPDVMALWQKHPWVVRIESNIPMGCGLGSSAALTGALARTFARGITGKTSHTVSQMAHQAERYFHGHPSGVDTTLALGDGLVTFHRVTASVLNIEPCRLGPFAIVAGTVPRVTPTKDLVARVRKQCQMHPDTTLSLLSQLGDLAALPEITESAWTRLGDRANEAQILLRTLGVSTSTLDMVLSAGLAAGAAGGKLSGAGGGGAFVLFCKNVTSAGQVALAVTQCGAHRADIYAWNGHSLLTTGGMLS